MQSTAGVGGHSSALRPLVTSSSGLSPSQCCSSLQCLPNCTTFKDGPLIPSPRRDTLQLHIGKGARAGRPRLDFASKFCWAKTEWATTVRVKAAQKTGSGVGQGLVAERRCDARGGSGSFSGNLTLLGRMPQRNFVRRGKCQRRQKRRGGRGAATCIQCGCSQPAESPLMLEERAPMSASFDRRQSVAKLLSCCAAMLVTGSPLLPAQALSMPPLAGGATTLQTNPPEVDYILHARSFTAPPLTSDDVTASLNIGNKGTVADTDDTPSLHSLRLDTQSSARVGALVSNWSFNLVSSLGDDGQLVELVNPEDANLKLPESKVSLDTPKSDEQPAESRKAGTAVDQKTVKNPVENSLPASSPDLNPEVNANLVLEAWNVVDQVYLDARGKGFDRDAWAAKRDEALKHPIRSRIAAYATIRGLMGSLNDPYTRFITPDQFQALSKFDVSGIGLNMGEVDDDDGVTSLRVLGVVHDSSAHAAGIRQNDALLSVGGLSVKGKSAFEATSLIQGPVGQPVTLELQRPTGEVFQAVVPRGKEAQQPVSYKLQKDAEGRPAGYVKLRDFSALAKKGVVEAIQRLREAGAQSFILDLQDNLGGLVQAGIEIARLFLDEGETVVYTVGRTPETQKNVLAQGPAVFSAPLIVLVNESTASASEIVAGALHDNCRALLVGNKTYGKGLIQSVYELTDGSALAITVGKYITPGHIDIDKYGIEPDFVRTPGPFNMFVPLPSVKEINAKLQACTPPEIERRNVSPNVALKSSVR